MKISREELDRFRQKLNAEMDNERRRIIGILHKSWIAARNKIVG
jgi:hypothetical protein